MDRNEMRKLDKMGPIEAALVLMRRPACDVPRDEENEVFARLIDAKNIIEVERRAGGRCPQRLAMLDALQASLVAYAAVLVGIDTSHAVN